MRVFITGATGFIGFNVATALRRAGHEVWALVRSAQKAQTLLRHEIVPVMGTMQDPASYRAAAEQASVLIHAAVDYQADIAALDRQTVEALIAAGGHGARPKTFIYTGGVWVHGNTGGHRVDETAPLAPPSLVAHRPAIEQLVINSTQVRGLVIRPGDVYGKQGSLTGFWFAGATSHPPLSVVVGTNHWPMVHVDDLADAYVRAAESGIAGEVFNVVDSSRATSGEMARAVAQAAGYSQEIKYLSLEESRGVYGPLADGLALDQLVDGSKAGRLLGWHPTHNGFIDGVEAYFAAWKAWQEPSG